VYIVAEIGCNHQGRLETAREMMRVAAECGVNAVKFQKRTLSEMPPGLMKSVYNGPNSFGKTYGEHREALELDIEQHGKLREWCRECGVGYICTPYDVPALYEVAGLGPDYIKIASCSLTEIPLLKAAKESGFPLIVSTGMSTSAEVLNAVLLLRGADVTLLQCTSCYPCDEANVHLRVMCAYRDAYELPVGLSDHTRGLAVSMAAAALGATMIERHFTLDRTWKGTDHAASLEPSGLKKLVRDCRNIELALGDPEKRRLECEESAWRKLRLKELK